MHSRKNSGNFFGFLLIPIISSIIWSVYYAIDTYSFLQILKLLLPIYIVLFLVGEFLIRVFGKRLSPNFKSGFWWGVFIFAPFFMFQIANQPIILKAHFPFYIRYPIYVAAGLLSATAIGLIIWALYDLILNTKNADNPSQMMLKRFLVLVLAIVILLPVFSRNRAAHAEILSKRTSYRAFVERELRSEPAHRVIVLGVDGGDWQVIEPLIEEGKLPAFKKLMEKGQWGTLKSIKPMRSPELWTTIFTGHTPDVHGIDDWLTSNSQNRLVKAVWNILSEYNLRSTIINIPGTYPPEELVGKEISGFPYPNQTMNIYGWLLGTKPLNRFLYTPFRKIELKLDADGNYKGKIAVSDVLTERFIAGIRGKVYRNMLLDLLGKINLGYIYGRDYEIARFKYYKDQKRFDILPLKGNGEPLASLNEGDWSKFLLVNLKPGVAGVVKIKAIELADDEVYLYMTPLFAPSDKPKHDFTFPNALAKDITDFYGQYIIDIASNPARDLITLPAIKQIHQHMSLQKMRIGKALFDEEQWDLFIQVFTQTDRVKHACWPFVFGGIPEDRLESFDNADVIENEGKNAIQEAYVYVNQWFDDILDKIDLKHDVLLIISDHGFTLGTGDSKYYGVHRENGIYIICGGPVEPVNPYNYEENKSSDRSVLDITRNVLYLMGLPVGKDMGGEVWFDLFDEDYIAENPVETIETYNKAEEVMGTQRMIDPSTLEQLKGLGYIDGANIEGN